MREPIQIWYVFYILSEKKLSSLIVSMQAIAGY